MKKVLVIGCSGAGKSVFSRALAVKTGLPLIHLDQVWHKADGTHITREDFDARLAELLAEDAWIIDGDYSRTLAVRLAVCDTVFHLDYPLDVCLAGIAARIGTDRTDLPWVETEVDPAFRAWVEAYPAERLPAVREALAAVRGRVEIVTFHSRAEADAYLAALS